MDSFELIYPNSSTSCTNVLLIDNSVMDSRIFYNSVNENTFPIIYSNTSLKTKLLEVLKQFTIYRIGIVFTYPVVQFLDNKSFFDNENVEFIKSLIDEFSITNIDYLACNTLNDPKWVEYYSQISETGVVVGASNDRTGNVKYGGDWVMETTSQDIELIYFTKSIEYYTYLLDGYTNFLVSMKNDGTIWGCGDNGGGQLGIAQDDTTTRAVLTQMKTDMLDGRPVSITFGYEFTLVLTLYGTIWGCGENVRGQLGIAQDDTTNRSVLTQMKTDMLDGTPIAISSGYNHTFVLTTNGIWGCGDNGGGQLGIAQDDTTSRSILTQMKTDMLVGTPTMISGGFFYTIVLTTNGIWGCGDNVRGQLGIAQDDTTNRSVLTQMKTDMLVGSLVAIFSGFEYTIVLTANGIWGCGKNDFGQLGIAQDDTTSRSILTQMKTDMLVGTPIDISSGYDHTIVLTTHGIWGCGRNNSGQLGTDDNVDTSILTQMKTDMLDGTPINISCGSGSTYVLTSNGTIWGTGYNHYGQLGTSDNVDTSILTQMTTNNNNFVYLSDMNFTLPLSDICFPAGTPVQTDQGIVAIDHLKPDFHSMNGQLVVDITKTITTDKHLVEFQKDSLGPNYPYDKVRVSKEHMIQYRGVMYAAKTFVANFDADLIPYHGETLYNVLLEKHSTMSINGLICETLHPDNLIAKLYTKKCKLDVLTRNHYAATLLECLKTQDIEGYQRIAQLC